MKYILMLTFGLYSFTATADFYSALNFYDQEQYSKAYEEFSKLAELGDKRSQFNLGIMYFKGQHVAQDINKAYAWTKLATESDLATPDEKKIHQLIANKIENIELATKAYQELSANYNAQKIINKLYPELVTESVAGKKNRVEPVKIVEPKYPRSAALKSIQGWVRVRFDIDKKGNPRNIRIIESFPGDTFVENSLRSIRQWRFETLKDENGSPTTALDQGYTLEFRLQGLELTVADEQYQALAGKAQQGDAESQFLLGYWHEKLDSLSANVNPTEMYLKSAVQGYAPAQYKLGHSLIMGNGCRKDKEKGLAWLTRAAANGQLDAQEYLAGLALQTPTRESQLLALSYLNNLEQSDTLSASATIRFSWLLATSAYQDIADPKRAIKILDHIKWNNYRDSVTKNEILAAAYAAMGNFDEAVDYQDDALDDAEDLNYDTSEIEARLNSYRQKKTWF